MKNVGLIQIFEGQSKSIPNKQIKYSDLYS